MVVAQPGEPTAGTAMKPSPPARLLPLFQTLLGDAWSQLPPPIRRLHTVDTTATYSGKCTVQRGRHPLAWLMATVIGFPKAQQAQPMELTLCREGDGERWWRRTPGSAFSSRQRPGRGRSTGLLREQFGPLAVDMALIVNQGQLHYSLRRWSVFGLPMPLWLGPTVIAHESADGEVFCFDVEVRHRFVGVVVHYSGRLCPQPAHA